MLSQFRQQYPQGSLTSELLRIDHGLYIVRAIIQVEDITLASGLAAAPKIEEAEDQARLRALSLLNLDTISAPETASVSPKPIPSLDLPTPSVPAPVLPVVPESIPSPKNSRKTAKVSSGKTEAIPFVSDPEISLSEVAKEVSKSEILNLQSLESPKSVTVSPSIAVHPPVEPEEPEPELRPELPLVVPPALTLTTEPELLLSAPEPIPMPAVLEPALAFSSPEPAPSDLEPVQASLEIAEVPAIAVTTPETPETVPNALGIDPNAPIDFSEIIARSNVELKRLGWTSDQGRNYLLQTYGKRSRQLLSDEELLEFLVYLEAQPNPV